MKKAINTTLDIDATPVEIWDVLIDFPAHEKWNPFFARIVGEATVGTTIKITARKDAGGDGMSFSPTVLEADPGRMLRWKGKFLVNGLFDGEHSFELTDLGDGRAVADVRAERIGEQDIAAEGADRRRPRRTSLRIGALVCKCCCRWRT